ncbi:MAG: hypothetical protein FWE91_13105 [Defluviitaleaceae bacterium]|nr:hypothetical protein [Defluviitaleaceae bacterium]MCL2837179.1 hypothetical protein [Defluviitaleaceae bacterium]
MLNRFGKRVTGLLLVLTLVSAVLPAHVEAAPSFTNSIRNTFINWILDTANWDVPYDYYALHDFDGDGIPEILMGRNNREDDPYFTYYAIWKYDLISKEFVHIGTIEESRYLMKDNYSNAIIAIYADTSRQTDAKAYFNYYITDNRVGRNTMLTRLTSPGWQSVLVYDTMFIEAGYYRNDILIDRNAWNEAELNILGSYDELIVHDWRGFNRETVTVAVNSWRPHEIVRRPQTFSSADRFTRTWQMPMYDLIMEKRGPADTLISEEDTWLYELWPYYGQQQYERFALHDLDGDGVPELLLGLRYLDHFSWDVYKWWNNEMRYIGSFDSYSKYLATVRGDNRASNDIFTFDPVPNAFYRRTVKRISFADNMLQNETLLAISDTGSAVRHLEGTRYNISNDRANPRRSELVNISGGYNTLVSRLVDYTAAYREIKTFDIYIVPPSAALIMYIKTNGFTRR